MEKLRIGKIPYLNSVLFFHPLEYHFSGRLEFHPMVPSKLTNAVNEGEMDAGPVPLVTTWDIEDRYEPMGQLGISTTYQAGSIFLYARKPMRELDGATIGVTEQTSTSVRLLRALLTQKYGVNTTFAAIDREHNDAFLLIGDDALRHRNGVDGFPVQRDLGRVWRSWTGLPFVFARWVVRRDLPQDTKDWLRDTVTDCLGRGWQHLDKCVTPKLDELGLSQEEARQYLEGFRFQFTPDEMGAIARFRELDARARAADQAA